MAHFLSGTPSEADEASRMLQLLYFERGGMKAPESFVRARIMYFHQVGYFDLALDESLADRAVLAPYYYSALTGSPAPDGLVDDMLALAQKKAGPRTTRGLARTRALKSST